MYCPRCAAQNLDDAKFCRGCGTSLETVALALSGQYQPAANSGELSKDWLAVRHEGVQRLIRGIGLLGAALLIGVALGLFSDTNDWIIIWLVFVGWMAAWGCHFAGFRYWLDGGGKIFTETNGTISGSLPGWTQ